MPTDPAHDPGESPPTCGPPVHLASMDFTDLRRVLTELGAIPPDTITPSEAAEELDDREAEELAVIDAIEREADGQPGAKRTWAEADASVEADRRFDLDALQATFQILGSTIKRPDHDEATGDEWKAVGLDTLPGGVKAEYLKALREVARTAGKLAARIGGDS